MTVKREQRSSVDADGCGARTDGTFIRLINGVVLVRAAAIYGHRNVLLYDHLAHKASEKPHEARSLIGRTFFFPARAEEGMTERNAPTPSVFSKAYKGRL